MAVRTETKEDAPWIAKVMNVGPMKDDIDVIWMDGDYNKQWKVAKMMVRRGRSRVSVEWKDMVAKASVILYGFELTNSSRLKQDTVRELKELYNEYFK